MTAHDRKLSILYTLGFLGLFFFVYFLIAFSDKGIVIQRDFNFPVHAESFIASHLPMWNALSSQNTIEQLMRLPMRFPFVVLAMLGVSMSLVLKLLVVGTFIFSGLAMCGFLFGLAKDWRRKEMLIMVTVIAMVLFFVFNPTALQFSWEIGLLHNLAALPILFGLCLYRQKFSTIQYALIFSIVVLSAIGHPFLLITNTIIFGIFSIFIGRSNIFSECIRLAVSGVVLVVLLLWFLLPYMSLNVTSENLGRAANLERSTFEIVSDNSFVNIFASSRDKFLIVATAPEGGFWRIVHYSALYSLIALALLPLVLRRVKLFRGNERDVYFFCLMGFLACSILSYGLRSPIGELYWLFVDQFPLGWIFRSPLKFQLYQMFFLTVTVFLSMLCTLRGSKAAMKIVIVGVLFFGVSGSIIPGMAHFATRSMNPITLPPGYYTAHEYLLQQPGESKVLWYPKYKESELGWSRGHHIAPYDMKSSVRPSYNMHWGFSHIFETLYAVAFNYRLFAREEFYEHLSRLNVEYVVFHNDRFLPIDDAVLQYLRAEMDEVFVDGHWSVFRNRIAPVGYFATYDCVLVTEASFSKDEDRDCALTSVVPPETQEKEVLRIDEAIKKDLVFDNMIKQGNGHRVSLPTGKADGWRIHKQASSWASDLYGYSFDLLQSIEDPFKFNGTASSYSPFHVSQEDLNVISIDTADEILPSEGVDEWTINLPDFQNLELDGDRATVRVEKSSEINGWRKLQSPKFKVQYGEAYLGEFDLGYSGVDNLHVKMLELDDNGDVVGNRFGHVIMRSNNRKGKIRVEASPRTEKVSEISLEFWYIPNVLQDGELGRVSVQDLSLHSIQQYQEESRFMLNIDKETLQDADSVYFKVLQSPYGGEIDVRVSTDKWHKIQTNDPKVHHSWYKLEVSADSAGEAEIVFRNRSGFNAISDVTITNSRRVSEKLTELESIFTQEKKVAGKRNLEILESSSTKHKIKIVGDGGFILTHAESFDPSWRLRVDGNTYRGFKTFSAISGFYIPHDNKTERVIELAYIPEEKFKLGLWISGISLFSIIGYLIFEFLRRRKQI